MGGRFTYQSVVSPNSCTQIDVHFALPKDEEGSGDEKEGKKDPVCALSNDADTTKGTLFVSLRNMTSAPSNSAIRQYFEKWGEVKEVRDCKNSPK